MARRLAVLTVLHAGTPCLGVALSLAAIVVGGMVYVLWRPESLLMFGWFSAVGLDTGVQQLRTLAAPTRTAVPNWVVYALPQALWLFSGLMALQSIWRSHPAGWPWPLLLIGVAFGFEGGQALALVPGRFDPVDLALLVVACVLAFCPRRLPT